jgi:hypothetical protein
MAPKMSLLQLSLEWEANGGVDDDGMDADGNDSFKVSCAIPLVLPLPSPLSSPPAPTSSLSAIRSPLSALRSPLSALRSPLSVLLSPLSHLFHLSHLTPSCHPTARRPTSRPLPCRPTSRPWHPAPRAAPQVSDAGTISMLSQSSSEYLARPNTRSTSYLNLNRLCHYNHPSFLTQKCLR